MTGMSQPHATWPGAAASFLAMWILMMAAMMLPSLVPILWRYRQAVGRAGDTHAGLATAVAAAGYFFAWAVFGLVAHTSGTVLAAVETWLPALTRAVPIVVGVVVLVAGAVQLTTWRAHRLACWREAAPRGTALPGNMVAALRHGLRLGAQCGQSCAGLMVVTLALGFMDLRVMAVMTAAITAERLAPGGERVARATGVVVVASGASLIARAASQLLGA